MANTQGTTGLRGWIDERFPLRGCLKSDPYGSFRPFSEEETIWWRATRPI
jgi:hypothetical protein